MKSIFDEETFFCIFIKIENTYIHNNIIKIEMKMNLVDAVRKHYFKGRNLYYGIAIRLFFSMEVTCCIR